MRYINLAETRVSYLVFLSIASRWKYSMRDLSLPEQFARQLKLFSDFGPFERRDEFGTLVRSMPRMERLHIGHYRFEHTDVMHRRTTVKIVSRVTHKPQSLRHFGPIEFRPRKKIQEQRQARKLGVKILIHIPHQMSSQTFNKSKQRPRAPINHSFICPAQLSSTPK